MLQLHFGLIKTGDIKSYYKKKKKIQNYRKFTCALSCHHSQVIKYIPEGCTKPPMLGISPTSADSTPMYEKIPAKTIRNGRQQMKGRGPPSWLRVNKRWPPHANYHTFTMLLHTEDHFSVSQTSCQTDCRMHTCTFHRNIYSMFTKMQRVIPECRDEHVYSPPRFN